MNSIHSYMFVLLVALLSPAWTLAADTESVDYVRRYFAIDESVVSYLPGKGIEEYDRHGSGMSTIGSTGGFGLSIDDVSATVMITSRLEEGRYIVTVDLDPADSRGSLGFEKQDLDLTDLKPVAITLATSKEGRVYQLNLTPSVRVSDNTPKRLDVDQLRLHNWRFPDSPVLVDDSLYVGRINCLSSPVAFMDISGVASVEFSLYQLKDAEPWGVFSNGIVTLIHPQGQTIQISNVSNGAYRAMDLPGGPYRVWVRWSDPTFTVQQHREQMIEMRERIANGEFPNARVDYFDKQLARDPSPWIQSSGLRGLRKGERVDASD